ncbi:50S ribosomal protein L10 [bacterium]|nr:50S ribosomal protein L10 [bacterium]MBU1599179.1 50S ribosomal protein L10 [bacterium]
MKTGHLIKQKVIDSLKEKIGGYNTILLTDMSGLSVFEMMGLRRELKKMDAVYTVTKNRLFQRAAEECGFPMQEPLEKPTAFLFTNDPVTSSKVLLSWTKKLGKPTIKFGFLERKMLSKGDIERMSALPSKEVLIAKVLQGMQSPIYGLVFTLKGLLTKLLYTLKAIEEKKQ